jgi:hypothetical protein
MVTFETNPSRPPLKALFPYPPSFDQSGNKASLLGLTGRRVVQLLTKNPVISVTEVNLARVPRALEGEVKGGSSLEGAGKGRLWRKGNRKGVD